MSLMKCFNFKYFGQNLKKSKSLLLFLGFAFIIINFLYLFAYITTGRITVFDITKLGIVTMIFMYIIPIALSITLFNYIFKKKSVDFINSMPIDRKTLFITNSIGGILVILGLLLLNIVIMGIIITAIPTLYIEFQVFIEYIVLFSVAYIFVFMASNIAISVSGNVVTSIVVSGLILFFLPLLSSIINYTINSDVFLRTNSEFTKYFYSVYNGNYTLPAIILTDIGYLDDFNIFSIISILKMLFLSIIYFIVGLLLFCKRKMEVCETTFDKYYIHQFVKLLILFPFLLLVFIDIVRFNSYDTFSIFIIGVAIVIYILIYDLITKKEILNVKYNFISTLVMIGITFLISLSVVEFDNTKTYYIDDIDSIELSLDDFDFHIYNDDFIKISDKNDISEILNTNEAEIADDMSMMSIMLNIGNSKYYNNFDFNGTERKKIRDIVYKNYKDKISHYYDNAFIATVDDDIYKLDAKGVELLKTSIKGEYDNVDNLYENLILYMYIGSSVKSIRINSNINKELNDYIIKFINNKAFELLKENSSYNGIRHVGTYDRNWDYLEFNDNTTVKSIFDRINNIEVDCNKELYVNRFSYKNTSFKIYSNFEHISDLIVSEEAVTE